jgi:dipeptidyl aminopeptidase/acylaminoacyl peptidase
MPKRPIRPDDLYKMILVGDPQLGPTGDRMLFSRKTITAKNKYLAHLWTVDLEGRLQQWTQGEHSCSFGRWSPDGSWISFISGREGDASQFYLIGAQGGEAAKLTNFPEGSIGSYMWSPDSSKIALTFRPALPATIKEAVSERTDKGLSTPPLVADDLWYRLDGDGYFGGQRYEVWILDVKKAQASEGEPDECIVVKYREDV